MPSFSVCLFLTIVSNLSVETLYLYFLTLYFTTASVSQFFFVSRLVFLTNNCDFTFHNCDYITFLTLFLAIDLSYAVSQSRNFDFFPHNYDCNYNLFIVIVTLYLVVVTFSLDSSYFLYRSGFNHD